jgi:Icc-related predicted phosphoesterase
MIIYAVADIHGSPKRLLLIKETIHKLNPDILVVAGDISNYKNAISVIARLNDLPIPVLAIRGNSDLPRVENLLEMYPNIQSLHFKHISIDNTRFTGIGGTLPLPFRSRICLNEKRALSRLESHINGSQILVFHTPPRWAQDEVFGKFHAGSKNLYQFVKKNQPNVLICGHIHERSGITSIGKTLIVNCSINKLYSGARIEYHQGVAPKAELINRENS